MLGDEGFTRWFNFAVTSTSWVLLEKKDMPEHLKNMECLETVVSLQSLLNDLEDCGEATGLRRSCMSQLFSPTDIDSTPVLPIGKFIGMILVSRSFSQQRIR